VTSSLIPLLSRFSVPLLPNTLIGVEESQLLAYAGFVFAQRVDPPPNGRDRLAQVQVEALGNRRVDLPASLGEYLLDGLTRAEHHAMFDPNDAPPAVGLDDLRIEELRQGHPAGFGYRPFALTPFGLNPLTVVCGQCDEVVPKAVSQKARCAIWRQDLGDLMDETLRHGESALTDVNRQDELGDWLHGHPHPVGRALQALDGFVLGHFPVFDGAEQSKECVHLHLLDIDIVQKVA
jgi:hypothetical protein